jgi:inosine-uridine nucleoside N-ribohydrolase
VKVIFDTDPGIDDAMALMYLHGSDLLELVGITSITGNASVEQCTVNALFLCETLGIDCPVFQGEAGDVTGKRRETFPDFVHGSNGLAEINVRTTRAPENESAVSFLCRRVSQEPGEVTIIAVGQLTNIALAIQRDPAFSADVREIIIMGGACDCEGNVSPWAEANIAGDPKAAGIVFDSGIPLTLVGLDVTMQTRMSHDYVDRICNECPDIADLLRQMTDVYASHYLEEQGLTAFPVHDSSAVTCAELPQYFNRDRGWLTCVQGGEETGRTLFRPDPDGIHLVCRGVDSSAVLARYHEVMLLCYSPSA